MSPQLLLRAVVVSVAGTLLSAACAPAAPAPTTPPKPAASPAAAAPGASPAAKPAASPAVKPAASPAAKPAGPPTTVQIAALRGASDSGLFIAIEKGYFAEQGIEAQFAEFGFGSDVAAMMAGEQIQIGGATITAGLLNAAARGIDIKIVADKGRLGKDFPWNILVARKDLVDSGAYKSLADLKGKKIAIPDLVSGGMIALEAVLQRAGLSPQDVELVSMPFPDHIPALANRAIDVAVTIEPFPTIMAGQNIATPIVNFGEVLEDYQIAVLMYSPRFAATDTAKRFMLAYVKGVRDYNDAVVKKQNLDAIAEMIAKHSTTKDVALIKRMAPVGLNPDGFVNARSIENDVGWYVKGGHVKDPPDLRKLIDNSYAEAAVQQLGRYAR